MKHPRIERFQAPTARSVVALGSGVIRSMWWDARARLVRPVPVPPAGSHGAILLADVLRPEADTDVVFSRLLLADWYDDHGEHAFAAFLRRPEWKWSEVFDEISFPAAARGFKETTYRRLIAQLRAELFADLDELPGYVGVVRGAAFLVGARKVGAVTKRRVVPLDFRDPATLPQEFDVTPFLDGYTSRRGSPAKGGGL